MVRSEVEGLGFAQKLPTAQTPFQLRLNDAGHAYSLAAASREGAAGKLWTV